MKLALFTIFRVPNFGSVLQAYATQKILEQQGHECVVIDYQNNSNLKHKVKLFFSPYHIACMLGLKPQFRKPKKLGSFVKRNFHLSKKYYGIDELRKEDWSRYDALVVGSDQVWNYKYLGENIYILPFLKSQVPCYSVASSFACKSLPNNIVDIYRHSLRKFTAISVREQYGIDILNQLSIGIRPKLLLDPTLLLSGEEWLSSVVKKRQDWHRTYILMYMWTYAFEPRPYIYEVLKFWQKKIEGCEIIALEGSPKKGECPELQIEDVADSSISQFMDYFANASLVVTSSFHGTAFAINFGRPLISIVPDGDDDRQSSLLNVLGAQNCIIRKGTPIESINPYYDVESTQLLLAKIRKDNKMWINETIK